MSKENIKNYDATIHDLRNVEIAFTFLVEELSTQGFDATSEDGKKNIQSLKKNLNKLQSVLTRLEDERSALQNALESIGASKH